MGWNSQKRGDLMLKCQQFKEAKLTLEKTLLKMVRKRSVNKGTSLPPFSLRNMVFL